MARHPGRVQHRFPECETTNAARNAGGDGVVGTSLHRVLLRSVSVGSLNPAVQLESRNVTANSLSLFDKTRHVYIKDAFRVIPSVLPSSANVGPHRNCCQSDQCCSRGKAHHLVFVRQCRDNGTEETGILPLGNGEKC